MRTVGEMVYLAIQEHNKNGKLETRRHRNLVLKIDGFLSTSLSWAVEEDKNI